MTTPRLSVLVVAWHSGSDLAELAAQLPDDPRFELVVVDNGGGLPAALTHRPGVRTVVPGRNLGFAGGCNAAAEVAAGSLLLFLNPDARPRPGALAVLLGAAETDPATAGFAPRLVGSDGRPQTSWQLRPLPGPWALLAHAFFWNPTRGPAAEPPGGTPIGQPAAAALLLRRPVFEAIGGFDAAFHPAWFEDVDLARRLAAVGAVVRYAPQAEFEHRGGSSVPAIGYRGFLAAYDRNLERYLAKHHGRGWAAAFRWLVPVGALLRLAALPVRRPRRTASRLEAARALWAVARGAPRRWPMAGEAA